MLSMRWWLAVFMCMALGCQESETSDPGDATPDVPVASDVVDGDGADGDATAPPMLCNGMAALCDRPFDEVVFPTTHNAMSSEADGWFGPNQQFGMARQLQDGVRGMLLDTHDFEGEIYLCHGLCSLGSTPFSVGLETIRSFLVDNPNEVLALILQDGTPTETTAAAFEVAGLAPFIYTHPDVATPWPTLRQMIASKQRLVVTAESGSPPPAWYHHVWDLTWDTPYSFDSLEAFDCRCNRGCPADKPLFLLNHWLSDSLGLPDPTGADVVNSFDFLHGRAMECWQESGRIPNFVAVDHYAVGDLFEVVEALNEAVGTQ